MDNIPTFGVSLRHIITGRTGTEAPLDFRVRLPMVDMPTFQYCQQYVQPICADNRGLSYAESLHHNSSTRHLVKPVADVFVSHAWSCSWSLLIQTIVQTCNPAPLDRLRTQEELLPAKDVYLWIDVLCLPQPAPGTPDFNHFAQRFSGALRKINRAIITAYPYYNPVSVGRAWCVFEHYTIASNGIPFEVVMTPSDHYMFRALMIKYSNPPNSETSFLNSVSGVNSFQHGMEQFLKGIDVQRCTATKPDDCVKIMTFVKTIGSEKVSKVSREAIGKWLTVAGEGFLKDLIACREPVHVIGMMPLPPSISSGEQTIHTQRLLAAIAMAGVYAALGHASKAKEWWIKAETFGRKCGYEDKDGRMKWLKEMKR